VKTLACNWRTRSIHFFDSYIKKSARKHAVKWWLERTEPNVIHFKWGSRINRHVPCSYNEWKFWDTVKNSKLSYVPFLSLLTVKRQENWFLAWRVSVYVCACACVRVCVRKSSSVDVLRTSWPIRMKISVYVAIGLESRTSPNQCSRTNISPQFCEKDNFCNSFNTFISKNIIDIEKQKRLCRCRIWNPTNSIQIL